MRIRAKQGQLRGFRENFNSMQKSNNQFLQVSINFHQFPILKFIEICCFCIVILIFDIWILNFSGTLSFAQGTDIDFNLDVTSKTKATPNLIKKPGIDLSGRGFSSDPTWPQNLACPEVLAQLEQYPDLQGGIFRLQFDLWGFAELAKNKQMQAGFLENYSAVIRNINAKGGITLLVLYGMPPGLGKVLDKTSSPWDIKAFKELVKEIIRYFSCQKCYNIWYEVWNAPDLDNFFLGEKQEYCPECCYVVPIIAKCDMMDSEFIMRALNHLEMNGSIAAPGFKPAEGIIIYHTAGNLYFKKTILNDEKGKDADK